MKLRGSNFADDNALMITECIAHRYKVIIETSDAPRHHLNNFINCRFNTPQKNLSSIKRLCVVNHVEKEMMWLDRGFFN